MPNLLQNVSNGNYYGRIKVGGKLIRESLGPSVWSTARLRLVDFLKTPNEARPQTLAPLLREAVDLFKSELSADTSMKPRSKGYRLDSIGLAATRHRPNRSKGTRPTNAMGLTQKSVRLVVAP